MTKFSEFLESQSTDTKKAVEPTMYIDGSFNCQTCDECVDEADYYAVQKILKWTCGQGHVSFIEDFKL